MILLVNGKATDHHFVQDQYQVKHGEIGEYVVRFDNTHSMMRKKTLKYDVVVENPPEDLGLSGSVIVDPATGSQ
jgi:hypothetical protein